MSVWFITGISRGLGRALASAVLARGHTVAGTTRSGTSDLETGDGRLHVLALDVADPGGAEKAVRRAHELGGGLDVVVNNAGYGLLGAVEEADDAETAEVFDVNFFGTLRIIRAALPLLRAQRRGHIVNISSIASLDPQAGAGLYASAKSAMAAMSQALAAEVAPLGIRVTVVEPGVFRTEFLSERSLRIAAQTIDDYESTSGALRKRLEQVAGRQPGDPAKAAEVIIDAVESAEPPLHLVLGSDALERTRANVQRLLGDLDRWEGASRNTAFVDVTD